MARRRQSLFEDVIELVALMPWWAGCLLAIVVYLLIHPFAMEASQTATSIGELGEVTGNELKRTMAMFGQYILPAAFLIGAAVSAIRRVKRKKLLATTSAATGQGAVKSLSWEEFELLVGEAFRQKGYVVQETGYGADGGVDLEMRKDGELHLVQCKQWRATKVGVSVVRELFGVMAGWGADHGYVVTSGAYTREARDFAEGRNITLIDGCTLEKMLKDVAQKPHFQKDTTIDAAEVPAASRRGAEGNEKTVPACPVCGSVMIRRTARRGANVGNDFWGCASFPKCRGTRQLEL